MTRQKQIEAQLQQAVAQHERLVSETHRRVKSNLQVVSSLLRVELACADDAELRHLAQETQNRIRAIAVMHEWLLQSPDRSSVDMKVYLERITRSLSLAYAARGTARVVCEADALTLEVDQATRIGLIVNELVVNALKHAFVRRARGGIVAVRLARSGADAELVVRDNGSGLPTGFVLESSASLGLTLVNDLAARLGAALTIESGRGTAVRLTFPCHDPA